MSKVLDLLINCGGMMLTETVKNVLAPRGYHPNKHYLNHNTQGDEIFITTTILAQKNPTTELSQMRMEGMKILNSFGHKFLDTLTQKVNDFGDEVEKTVNTVKSDLETKVDKSNVLIDAILYRMADRCDDKKLVYTSDFGAKFKAEIAKCGLDSLPLNNAKVYTEIEAKYGKSVDYRLNKYGINEDNGYTAEQIAEYRLKLIHSAANNNCTGADDSVKFSLLESFFDGMKSFVKGILHIGEEATETLTEIGLSLLTGEVVDLDDIKKPDQKLKNDNTVSSKGHHLKFWKKNKVDTELKNTDDIDKKAEQDAQDYLKSLVADFDASKDNTVNLKTIGDTSHTDNDAVD